VFPHPIELANLAIAEVKAQTGIGHRGDRSCMLPRVSSHNLEIDLVLKASGLCAAFESVVEPTPFVPDIPDTPQILMLSNFRVVGSD
jgi:hypothetical protein